MSHVAVTSPAAAPLSPLFTARTVWDWAEVFQARLASGAGMLDLIKQTGKSRRYIQKALWLLTWPSDLQDRVRSQPTLFCARVLLNHFASQKRRLGSRGLDGWRSLRREIARVEASGRGVVGKRLRSSRANRPKVAAPVLSPGSKLRTEALLRTHLQTLVTVEGDQIRIQHFGEADLERLLEVMGVSF